MSSLSVTPGESIVDATFGAGGYTRALLSQGARVIAFDRDPDAIAEGQALVAESRRRADPDPGGILADGRGMCARRPVDGVTLDIGVSSMQLDRAERGFSFQSDGPLDMTMARTRPNAADFVNEADEGEIADVLYTMAKSISRAGSRARSSRRGR